MLRPSKLVAKLEDLVEKKCGPWYVHIRRHDKGQPLENGVPCGNVFGRRLVLVFQRGLLNSLKLGRQATFHLPGQEVPNIWVVNPFKNWFVVFTPEGNDEPSGFPAAGRANAQ